MQALKTSQLRLLYEDGSEVVATIRPLDLIRAERHYGGDLKNHLAEATLFAGWLSLGSPGSPERNFDQWLATLVSFEEGEGDFATDPTSAAAPADEQQS